MTMFSGLVGSTFGASALIRHRFDLRNIARSLILLSRVGTVVFCFAIWPASLWHVGVGFVISALIGFVADVLIWKKLTPQLAIDRKALNRNRLRDLLDLSGWSSVNLIGFLLLMQVDLLIVNALFGAEMTGLYGVILIFPALIHTMVETVVAVLSPAIMARYAANDSEGLKRLAIRSVKFLGLGLALPVGLLCGFGRPLLSLWLGPNFQFAAILLLLLVAHLVANLALRPLAYVLTAHNQMKIQGLLTLALGIVNPILAIGLVRWAGWGVAAVPLATALVWTIRNVVFVSGYSAGVLGLRWWAFYPSLLPGTVGLLGVTLATQLISHLWWPTSWLVLGAMAAAVATGYCVLAWAIGLNRSDRAVLWNLARSEQH
jgi:membrane protein EpsK